MIIKYCRKQLQEDEIVKKIKIDSNKINSNKKIETKPNKWKN